MMVDLRRCRHGRRGNYAAVGSSAATTTAVTCTTDEQHWIIGRTAIDILDIGQLIF